VKDRRTELRFGVDQPAVVSFPGGRKRKEIPARIVEASKSGLRIAVDVPVKVGSLLEVKWDSSVVTAEARHCRQTGPETYSVGLKISEVIGRGKLRTQSGAA
jgi:hypothetical protein